MTRDIEQHEKRHEFIGGHFVTGHVDGCGTIGFLGPDGADWRLDIAAPVELMAHVVRKGCIAVDGMSLTVADLLPGGFRIWLIPHTLAVTNLGERKAGDRVNLETDLLAKYVLRYQKLKPTPPKT